MYTKYRVNSKTNYPSLINLIHSFSLTLQLISPFSPHTTFSKPRIDKTRLPTDFNCQSINQCPSNQTQTRMNTHTNTYTHFQRHIHAPIHLHLTIAQMYVPYIYICQKLRTPTVSLDFPYSLPAAATASHLFVLMIWQGHRMVQRRMVLSNLFRRSAYFMLQCAM